MIFKPWWEVLEVSKTASKGEIRKAYALLVKHYHPEDNPEEYAILRFAYEQGLSSVEREMSFVENEVSSPQIIVLGNEDKEETQEQIRILRKLFDKKELSIQKIEDLSLNANEEMSEFLFSLKQDLEKTKVKTAGLEEELLKGAMASAEKEIKNLYDLYANHKRSIEEWSKYINSRGFKENSLNQFFLRPFLEFLFNNREMSVAIGDMIARYFYEIKNESTDSLNVYKEINCIVYLGSINAFEYDNYNPIFNYADQEERVEVLLLLNKYAKIYELKRHDINAWKAFFEEDDAWMRCNASRLLLFMLTYFILANNNNYTKEIAQYQITIIREHFSMVDEDNVFLSLIIGILSTADCNVEEYEENFKTLQNKMSKLIKKRAYDAISWQELTKCADFFKLNRDIAFVRSIHTMIEKIPKQQKRGYEFITKYFYINQYSFSYAQMKLDEYGNAYQGIRNFNIRYNLQVNTIKKANTGLSFVFVAFLLVFIIGGMLSSTNSSSSDFSSVSDEQREELIRFSQENYLKNKDSINRVTRELKVKESAYPPEILEVNGKYAIVFTDGTYCEGADVIQKINEEFYMVQQNGKWKLYNFYLDKLLPGGYVDMQYVSFDAELSVHVMVSNDGVNYAIMNKLGFFVSEFIYTEPPFDTRKVVLENGVYRLD